MNIQIAQTFDGGLNDIVYGALRVESGITVVADSASLAVNMHGADVPIAGTPSIDSNTGVISYTWEAIEIATLIDGLPGLSVRARWSIVKDGVTYERTQFFDVVAVAIATNVVDNDVVRMYPQLTELRKITTGVSTGPEIGFDADLYLYDTKRRSEPSQWFLGSIVTFTSGSNAGSNRICVLHDGEANFLELNKALENDISRNDTYAIASSYQPAIDRAWLAINSMLLNKFGATRLAGRVDGNDLKQAHIALSVAEACREKLLMGNEEFTLALTNFEKQFDREFSRAQVKISQTGEDGVWDPDSDDLRQPIVVWNQ